MSLASHLQRLATTAPYALRAVLVAALVFGLLHATPALVGEDLGYVLANLAGTAASGFWWAALTLASGSIWPAVAIHAATNAALLVVPYAADALGPLRAVALEAPWILFGLWLLLDERRFPRHLIAPTGTIPDTSRGADRSSALGRTTRSVRL